MLRDACAARACGMRTRRSTSSRRSRNARSSTKSPTVTERSAACPRRSPRAHTTLCAQCKVCAVLCRRLTAAQGWCAVWAVRTRLPTPLLLSPPVGSRHGGGLSDFLARQRSKTSSWTSISVRRARSVPPDSAMSTGTRANASGRRRKFPRRRFRATHRAEQYNSVTVYLAPLSAGRQPVRGSDHVR